jgi:hypothetical protein
MGIDPGKMDGVVVLTNGQNGAPLASVIASYALDKLSGQD